MTNVTTLDAVDNDETGTSITATVTPPAAGNYSSTKIRYRVRGETDWSEVDHIGVQGAQSTKQITGLTNNKIYDVVAMAQHGGDYAAPSAILNAWCSDLTGPPEERILENIESVLATVTTAAGYNQTIRKVLREADSFPIDGSGEFPCADIRIDRWRQTLKTTVGWYEHVIVVEIHVFTDEKGADIDDPAVAALALSNLSADVRKVLEDDWSRGGDAIEQEIESGRRWVMHKHTPSAVGLISVGVRFRHPRANPFG
jgi:hypothetical protein